MNSSKAIVNIELELSLATNLFGEIKEPIKEQLRELINNPNRDNWDECQCLILSNKGAMLTLWQAVIACDPSFPRTGVKTDEQGRILEDWQRIPDRELLLSALFYATH